MSVLASTTEDGKTLTILISGHFDFKSHQEFRKAYEQSDGAGVGYVIDMDSAEYMDSSALGMLLMLREHAGGDSGDVRIINTRGEIGNILSISNFQKLFKIEE